MTPSYFEIIGANDTLLLHVSMSAEATEDVKDASNEKITAQEVEDIKQLVSRASHKDLVPESVPQLFGESVFDYSAMSILSATSLVIVLLLPFVPFL